MKKRPNRPMDLSLWDNNLEQSLGASELDTPERMLAYCREHNFFNGEATDIEGLINSTPELDLVFEDLDGFDAYIQKVSDSPTKYRIAINKRHPKKRQRFSMAHEYIHYQIHRDKIQSMPEGEQIMHRSEERNNVEATANHFAAELLMPEESFKHIARACNGDISKIAECFDVSLLAVRYRAKKLGIEGHGL